MTKRTCSLGIWDESVPGIKFDKSGISNYALLHKRLSDLYPRGKIGELEWNKWVERITHDGRGKKYDCIIGVSGGTDSSYLLHLSREYNLRPLAVNLDNGWNSHIAVKNIKRITSSLNVDLDTYVINYEVVKAVLRAFIKAGLPWIDAPTDLAIKSILYRIAAREGIKYILNGGDFRSEGKQPTEWTYCDSRQLNYIVRKFERINPKSFPVNGIAQLMNFTIIHKIIMLRPYYYLPYKKSEAQLYLKKHYNWEYYGGHHHENLFTKFAISYWLPKKFGIDKRIITLSAQIMSGEIDRQEALNEINKPPFNTNEIEKEKTLVLKKLDLSDAEFDNYWNNPNKYYYDYPSFMPIYKKFHKLTSSTFKNILPFTPSIFVENDIIT